MMNHNANLPPNRVFRIFISYRRDDTAGHAGHLYALLSEKFVGRVFMDISEIEAGRDFVDAINDAIDETKVLIVLIGREWLTITNSAGRRRLDDSEDPVRVEIAEALKSNIRVIPVLVERATMPRKEELPEELARLARLNAIELSDERWTYDVQRLVGVIEKELPHRVIEPGSNDPKKPRSKRMVLIACIVASLIALATIGFFLQATSNNSGNTNDAGNTNDDTNAARARLTGTLVPSPSPETQPEFQALVNVSKAEAEFVFPVDTDRMWKWNLEETELYKQEYGWHVELISGDTTYQFSIYNYKNPGMKQTEDGFASFVNVMGKDAAYIDPKTKKRVQIYPVMNKRTSPGKLSITVQGEQVRRVFSTRPKEAKFLTIILKESYERRVTIDYKDF